MSKAICTLCRALAQALEAHYRTFDPVTSALLVALMDYVNANQE